MKYIFILPILFLLAVQSCKAPKEVSISGEDTVTVVSFNSICCGVRSDAFLKSFFETFKAQNNVKLYALKVTGCGKEGEYKIIFGTGNLSFEMNKKFTEGLRSIVQKETDNNKGNEQGTVNVEIVDAANVSQCRDNGVNF